MGLQEMFRLYWQTEEAIPEQRALPHEEAVEAFLQWCRNPENFNWKNGGETQRWLMENGYSPTLTITTMDARTKEYLKLIGCSDKEIARRELEEKIDQSLLVYRREHLKGPQELTTADWTAIYRQAGMSDKEIAEYRKENELTPGQKAALNDQVEQYNS